MSVEAGYYYHYKHDESLGFTSYAYKVLGIGHHTEIKNFSESAMVVYLPLYETAPVYKEGKHYDLKPLKMFLETVENGGNICPRYTRIKDPLLIKRLEAQFIKMYN